MRERKIKETDRGKTRGEERRDKDDWGNEKK